MAIWSSNNFHASGVKVPARGVAALDVAIRFAAASIIRCRSADLVGVQPNFRLPPVSTMRRAPAMPHSAGSPPPSKRHSRLTIVRRLISVTTCRRFMAKPCTPQCNPQAEQFFKCLTANVRGQGAGPLAFSWGFKGAILSRERMAPFPVFPAPRRESHCCLQAARICKALLL